MENNREGIASKAVGAVGDFEKGLRDFVKKFETDYSGWGTFAQEYQKMIDMVLSTVKPFSKVQTAAAELARSVGFAGESIMGISRRMVAQNKQMSLSMKYGMSNEEMLSLQATVMSKLGRNVMFDTVGMDRDAYGNVIAPGLDTELENAIAAAKALGGEATSDIIAGYDKVGKSMQSAAKAVGKLYKEAGETGINLQKYSQNFIGNLQMAQTYNFRRGVDGLREMAKRATEIRQDMQQVARFADKVGTVTGAVETAANLQVLGGSFTALANPLSMLNESLTDVEALQKRFSKMTENLATYNSTTKQIEIDPLSRMRMKAAAEAMGVDANNLFDQATAQARKKEIERQLTEFGNIDQKVMRLISNVGEISEQGVAGATIGGDFKTAAEIAQSPELQKQLVVDSRTESEDIKTIAKSVLTIEEAVTGRRHQIENELAINKVKEGVVDGTSTWDNAVSTILESFNDQGIAAIGRISFPFDNLFNNFNIAVRGAISDILVTPMSEDTIEGWRNAFSEGISKNFGEGPIANAFSSVATTVGEKLNSIATQVNDALKEVGIDFITVTKKGLPEEEAIRNATNYVQPAINPDSLNTGNTQQYPFSLRDTTTTMPPITGAQIEQATIAISTANFNENFGLGNNLFGKNANILDSDAQLTSAGQKEVTVFTSNKNTIPGAVVETDENVVQRGNAPEEQKPLSTDINVHFDGTITVNGDNGKIGAVDIMKILQESNIFRQELSKALADSLKEINSQR